MSRLYSLSLLIAVAGLLGGCASPATSTAMIPGKFEVGTQHAKSASVQVGGGQATSSMGKSQIGDAEFAAALVESINKSKTFSKVIQGQGADYLLNVTIFSMDQPSFGFSFTVKMEALWTLTKTDGSVIWKEAVKSEHTATTSDAFAGVERLRMANEGAARNNIALGLAKIGKLAL
jgi:hypothetical protein